MHTKSDRDRGKKKVAGGEQVRELGKKLWTKERTEQRAQA